MPAMIPRILSRAAFASLLAAASLATPAAGALDRQDFSPAEKLLLMSDQLGKLSPPLQLTYGFKKSGSLEAGFDDRAVLRLKAKSGGKACCAAEAEFLSGERKFELPPVEEAAGNPITMVFLERDIGEMKRLTKGSTTYFRKRIRMALYDGARVEPADFAYRGKTVAGQQIVIEPYRDDPNRARFENLARKQYVFTLSDAVPGAVAAIRTVIHPGPTASGGEPLLREDLVLQGVEPPPLPPMKALDPPAAASGAAPAR
jgi:hypothetical protein